MTLEQIVHGEKVRVDLPTGRTLEVAVPFGTRPGQTIRLKGQGRPGPMGGTPGDALVTVEFVPHPLFRVDGDTLRREIAVTLDEAVLGAKVRVPTLDGPVTLTVPPKSSGGRTLRLKGKGLPRAGGGRGDLLVALQDRAARRRRRRTGGADEERGARSKRYTRPRRGRRKPEAAAPRRGAGGR